jgi:HEPN domain-containing protein
MRALEGRERQVSMGEFVKDPGDWLRRLAPDEWIRAALGELKRASAAYASGDGRAGAAGVKRAAGMALNAALILEPNEAWGRSYVEHVEGLAKDEAVPTAVREACRVVLEAKGPSGGGELVRLRTPHAHQAVVEAAHDVIAHAWAVVKRHEARDG